MFVVMLCEGAACADLKEYPTYEEARREYRRQARNAWRRKSAYNQCQIHHVAAYSDILEYMTWRTGAGAFWCLEMRMATPDWIKAVRSEM